MMRKSDRLLGQLDAICRDEKHAVVTRWKLAARRFDWAGEPGGAPLGN